MHEIQMLISLHSSSLMIEEEFFKIAYCGLELPLCRRHETISEEGICERRKRQRSGDAKNELQRTDNDIKQARVRAGENGPFRHVRCANLLSRNNFAVRRKRREKIRKTP